MELGKLGVDVWWDHEVLGGDDYRDRISEVLTRAAAAIVVWSRRSVQSHWVISEAAAQVDSLNALTRAQKLRDSSAQAIAMLAVARVVASNGVTR